MPLYEYGCSKCGREFQLMRSFSDFDKPAPCPKCKAKAQRLMSVFAAKNGTFIRPGGSSAMRKPIPTTRSKATATTARKRAK